MNLARDRPSRINTLDEFTQATRNGVFREDRSKKYYYLLTRDNQYFVGRYVSDETSFREVVMDPLFFLVLEGNMLENIDKVAAAFNVKGSTPLKSLQNIVQGATGKQLPAVDSQDLTFPSFMVTCGIKYDYYQSVRRVLYDLPPSATVENFNREGFLCCLVGSEVTTRYMESILDLKNDEVFFKKDRVILSSYPDVAKYGENPNDIPLQRKLREKGLINFPLGLSSSSEVVTPTPYLDTVIRRYNITGKGIKIYGVDVDYEDLFAYANTSFICYSAKAPLDSSSRSFSVGKGDSLAPLAERSALSTDFAFKQEIDEYLKECWAVYAKQSEEMNKGKFAKLHFTNDECMEFEGIFTYTDARSVLLDTALYELLRGIHFTIYPKPLHTILCIKWFEMNQNLEPFQVLNIAGDEDNIQELREVLAKLQDVPKLPEVTPPRSDASPRSTIAPPTFTEDIGDIVPSSTPPTLQSNPLPSQIQTQGLPPSFGGFSTEPSVKIGYVRPEDNFLLYDDLSEEEEEEGYE